MRTKKNVTRTRLCRLTKWRTDALTKRFNCRTVCLSVSGQRRGFRRGLLESTAQIALLYWARTRLATLDCIRTQQAKRSSDGGSSKERESTQRRAAPQSTRERPIAAAAVERSRCVCACVRGFAAHCPIVLFTTNKQQWQQCQLPRVDVEREAESERAGERERHR